MERWRPTHLPGIEVSNEGRLRKGRRFHYTFSTAKDGSLVRTITVAGIPNTVRLARLVGAAFCKDYNPDRYPVYKNGDRSDCRAANLRWVGRGKVQRLAKFRK